jgi:hypothetical protein
MAFLNIIIKEQKQFKNTVFKKISFITGSLERPFLIICTGAILAQ